MRSSIKVSRHTRFSELSSVRRETVGRSDWQAISIGCLRSLPETGLAGRGTHGTHTGPPPVPPLRLLALTRRPASILKKIQQIIGDQASRPVARSSASIESESDQLGRVSLSVTPRGF